MKPYLLKKLQRQSKEYSTAVEALRTHLGGGTWVELNYDLDKVCIHNSGDWIKMSFSEALELEKYIREVVKPLRRYSNSKTVESKSTGSMKQ